jgi:deoxyadenosine/deoxycytidine kinase
MASSVTNRSVNQESRIIEIIGLAGSGKSTTCKKLRDGDSDALPTYQVARHRLPAAFLRALLWFASDATQRALRDPRGGWTGLHLSVHMDAMIRDLLFRRQNRFGTLFLDQGPIFNCISAERLAADGEIHEAIPNRMRELLVKNLDFLDTIVLLDADLSILLQRIDERRQGHRIKGTGEDTSRIFLEDYRERYDSIVDEIQNRSDIRVIRLDTGQRDPDQIVDAIRSALALSTAEKLPTTAPEPAQ